MCVSTISVFSRFWLLEERHSSAPSLGDVFTWCHIVHFLNTRFQLRKATAAATVRVLPMINSRGIDR